MSCIVNKEIRVAESITTMSKEVANLPVVLLVDDSKTIRTTASVFLKPLADQISLTFAKDGFEAVKVITQTRPVLIIADVLMPRLTGYQLCSIVKNDPKNKKTPFYILSSKDGQIDKAMGSQSGADGYMVKPFKQQDLLEVMAACLGIFPKPKAA